jgi:hypothetical protein
MHFTSLDLRMERTYLFETILFFNKIPCFYKVYTTPSGVSCEPLAHHFFSDPAFVSFNMNANDDSWKSADDVHEQLSAQMKSELQNYFHRQPVAGTFY